MTGSPSPFDVKLDQKQRLLRLTMRGFWSLADVAAFAAALRRAIEPLGPPPRRYDILSDGADFPVQSKEVSAAIGEINRIQGRERDGRVAIVVASAMNKLQVQRTLPGEDVRAFATLEEAMTWLEDARKV